MRQGRRGFIRNILLALLAGFSGLVLTRRRCGDAGPGKACDGCADREVCPVSPRRTVWQLDPAKCIQCGRCATNCVLKQSAVKCVHNFEMCGYCKLCFGFFQPGAKVLTSAAENQMCPVGAIRRKFVEDPYYEYTIDGSLCVGCGRCVRGCGAFGNGSLVLQVKHDVCVNCNECSIARNCPSGAFNRVPADQPYLFKKAPRTV